MSGLPPSLARYFEHAVPLVMGSLGELDDETRAGWMQASLGDSPSGTARLALARGFVRWQARHAMGALYARLRRTWDIEEPGRFDGVVMQWVDGHHASSGDPSSIGAGFDAFLSALDPPAPPWAPEMADLAFSQIAFRCEHPAHGLRPHALRFYQFVPQTTERRPAAWVLSLADDGRAQWVGVGKGEVLALARAQGETDLPEPSDTERDAGERFVRELSVRFVPS